MTGLINQPDSKLNIYLNQKNYIIVREWGPGNVVACSGTFKWKENAIKECDYRNKMIAKGKEADYKFKVIEITCNLKEVEE